MMKLFVRGRVHDVIVEVARDHTAAWTEDGYAVIVHRDNVFGGGRVGSALAQLTYDIEIDRRYGPARMGLDGIFYDAACTNV